MAGGRGSRRSLLSHAALRARLALEVAEHTVLDAELRRRNRVTSAKRQRRRRARGATRRAREG